MFQFLPVHYPLNECPRHLRTSHAVGVVDIEFAAYHAQFLGFAFNPQYPFAHFRRRLTLKELDEQFARVDIATRGERVGRDDAPQVGRGVLPF